MSEEKKGWFSRLTSGLKKSSVKLTDGITGIFTKRRLDQSMLDELEELLITADMGVETAGKLVARLKKDRFDKDVTDEEVRGILADEMAVMLRPVAQPLVIDTAKSPYVIVVVGVNGSGKTTTIGKMASALKEQGKSVMLAAADTFRAAAVEQLQIWGTRAGVPVITGDPQADPASVAFRGLEEALKARADVLIVDTAGRLHNKTGLMQELQKILRVLKKLDDSAPHETLLVLDATIGQNIVQQVRIFQEMAAITGLVMTKLDGTAKGGVLVGLAESLKLPVRLIGVGEQMQDYRELDAEAFARGLMGLAE